MDRGHEAAPEAKLVVHNLGERSEAVRRTRGGRHDGFACVTIGVHAVNERRHVVLRRRGHDDALGSGAQVPLGILTRQEDAGRFEYDVDSDVAPGGRRWILHGSDAYGTTVDDQRTIFHAPAEIVRQLRIEEARRLFEETALPLKDITTRTGFGDVTTPWRRSR